MISIDRLHLGDDRLAIDWSDGVTSEHLWLWLADHDSQAIHPDTHQREIHTAGIDPALRAVAASVVDTDVVVEWDDRGHRPRSRLAVELLAAHRRPGEPDRLDAERVLWDGESILEQWPEVDFGAVMSSDAAAAEWLELVARFGFCIVTGTPTTVEATETLARRIGYVRETIFGGMWDFQADLSKADTAYTNLELRPHTDGTYSQDAPGLQLLHCLAFDGTGGESTMTWS